MWNSFIYINLSLYIINCLLNKCIFDFGQFFYSFRTKNVENGNQIYIYVYCVNTLLNLILFIVFHIKMQCSKALKFRYVE